MDYQTLAKTITETISQQGGLIGFGNVTLHAHLPLWWESPHFNQIGSAHLGI
jgi:hypothetical protein